MRLVVLFNVVTLGVVGVVSLLMYPVALFVGAMANGGPNVTGVQTAVIVIVFVLGPGLVAASCIWAIWRSMRNLNSAVFIAGVIVIVIAVFHGPLLSVSAYLTGGSRGETDRSKLELRSR